MWKAQDPGVRRFGFSRGHFLAVSSHGLFALCFPSIPSSSCKDTSPIGSALHPLTSFNLSDLLKDTFSKQGHIGDYGFNTGILWGHNSAQNMTSKNTVAKIQFYMLSDDQIGGVTLLANPKLTNGQIFFFFKRHLILSTGDKIPEPPTGRWIQTC